VKNQTKQCFFVPVHELADMDARFVGACVGGLRSLSKSLLEMDNASSAMSTRTALTLLNIGLPKAGAGNYKYWNFAARVALQKALEVDPKNSCLWQVNDHVKYDVKSTRLHHTPVSDLAYLFFCCALSPFM